MSIALREFWTRMVRAGFTDAEGCKRLAADFRRSTGGDPEQLGELARYLVRAGELTEFQAKSLLAETPPKLRLGPFVRTARSSPPPFRRWYPVEHLASRRNGFLRVLDAEQLRGDMAARLQAQAAVAAETLQPIEFLRTGNDRGLVFSPLPAGRLLSDRLADAAGGPSADAVAIGISLAEALAALHRHGLVHGDLTADRVWVTDQGRAILLRDPSGATDRAEGWLDDLRPEASTSPFGMAPAGDASDPRGDLDRLGRLLFQIDAEREPLPTASSPPSTGERRTELPEELAEAVHQGAAGNPFHRVLAHAITTNPEARFRDADAMVQALRAVAAFKGGAERLSESPLTPIHSPAAPEKRDHEDLQAPMAASVEASARDVAARDVAAPEVAAPEVAPAKPPQGADSHRPSRPSPHAARSSSPPRRRRKQPLAPLVLGGLGVTVLVLVVAVLVYEPSSEPRPRPPRPRPSADPPTVAGDRERGETGRSSDAADRSSPAATAAARSAEDASPDYEQVDDDRLLWAPPYRPAPAAPRELLPPGPGIIATARLSRWLEDPAGRDLIDLFSPELPGLIATVERRTQVEATSIERLSVALHPGQSGWPEVSLAVELSEPEALSELVDSWQVAESRTPEGKTIHAGDEPGADAFYVHRLDTDDSLVTGFAVGSIDRISEVAELDGQSIPLPQKLDRLWKRSSDQADLVLLITPNFLLADARQLLHQSAPAIVDPLKELLIPNAAGWLLCVSLDEEPSLPEASPSRERGLYAETQMLSSGDMPETQLLRTFRDEVGRWPQWAETFLVRSVPDRSWRRLATRLPTMMRFVDEHARYGLSDGAAVANVYLPVQGAGQLGLATLLALNTTSSPAAPLQESNAEPLSFEQMLEEKMSINFDQESLEFAIEMVLEEFARTLPSGTEAPPVRILGSDLEEMSITQNQQVRDFDKRDQPLRRVLTDLVMEANPDRTASDPADPKQSLVWVVADDPENPGAHAILITTREAAADRYGLPAEFRGDP